MALNAPGLGSEMVTEIQTAMGRPAEDPTQLQKICDAIATAVVNHIKTNAQVIVTSVTGVQGGPSSSGPGTGTIT